MNEHEVIMWLLNKIAEKEKRIMNLKSIVVQLKEINKIAELKNKEKENG